MAETTAPLTLYGTRVRRMHRLSPRSALVAVPETYKDMITDGSFMSSIVEQSYALGA